MPREYAEIQSLEEAETHGAVNWIITMIQESTPTDEIRLAVLDRYPNLDIGVAGQLLSLAYGAESAGTPYTTEPPGPPPAPGDVPVVAGRPTPIQYDVTVLIPTVPPGSVSRVRAIVDAQGLLSYDELFAEVENYLADIGEYYPADASRLGIDADVGDRMSIEDVAITRRP